MGESAAAIGSHLRTTTRDSGHEVSNNYGVIYLSMQQMFVHLTLDTSIRSVKAIPYHTML